MPPNLFLDPTEGLKYNFIHTKVVSNRHSDRFLRGGQQSGSQFKT